MHISWIKACSRLLAAPALLLSSLTWAQSYPFNQYGTIDRSPGANGVMIVSDSVVQLTDKPIIHLQNGNAGAIRHLTPGSKIGYNGPTTAPVQEIWLLPADFDPVGLD